MKQSKKTPTMSATVRRWLMGIVTLALGLECALSQNVPSTNHVVAPLTNSVSLATVAKLTPTPAVGSVRNLHLATSIPTGSGAVTLTAQHPAPSPVTPIAVARPADKLNQLPPPK